MDGDAGREVRRRKWSKQRGKRGVRLGGKRGAEEGVLDWIEEKSEVEQGKGRGR